VCDKTTGKAQTGLCDTKERTWSEEADRTLYIQQSISGRPYFWL